MTFHPRTTLVEGPGIPARTVLRSPIPPDRKSNARCPLETTIVVQAAFLSNTTTDDWSMPSTVPRWVLATCSTPPPPRARAACDSHGRGFAIHGRGTSRRSIARPPDAAARSMTSPARSSGLPRQRLDHDRANASPRGDRPNHDRRRAAM